MSSAPVGAVLSAAIVTRNSVAETTCTSPTVRWSGLRSAVIAKTVEAPVKPEPVTVKVRADPLGSTAGATPLTVGLEVART